MARPAEGVALPDPCDAATFEASRPALGEHAGPESERAHERVRAALAVRRVHIAPRQHRLLTGQHTAQRVGQAGIRVCWRYADGMLLQLELNLGAQPMHVGDLPALLSDAQELLRHAWPDGTDRGAWPPWSARWTLGRPAT